MDVMQEVEYEDYTASSKVYDNFRVTPGFDHIKQELTKCCGGENRGHILEIGCGTGNYLVKLAPCFEKVSGIDLNEGMITVCKEKTKEMTNVNILVAAAQRLPFEDATFDAIYACQTVHHHGGDEHRQAFFTEAARVLKPKGKLILNYSEPRQIMCNWPLLLGPSAICGAMKNERTKEEYTAMAVAAGLDFVENFIVTEPFVHAEIYNTVKFMSRDEAFKCDSAFAHVPEDELEIAKKVISEMDENKDTSLLRFVGHYAEKLGLSSNLVVEKK